MHSASCYLIPLWVQIPSKQIGSRLRVGRPRNGHSIRVRENSYLLQLVQIYSGVQHNLLCNKEGLFLAQSDRRLKLTNLVETA
jgi:hypothetical protein